MFRSIVLLVGGLASLSAVSLFAQDAVLGQKYGSGVHAFFMGDSLKAHEQLTAAIQGGSKDPRVLYFRGLAYLKLGRPQEAAIDFRKGAELESKDINRFYNVGKALERVQGAARLELENYRVDARMAALEQLEKLRKLRYEAVKREEDRVLREQAVAVPEMPAGAPEAIPPGADSNPFDVPGAATEPKKRAATTGPAEKKGAEASPPAGEDPFAPPTKPDAKTPTKKGNLFDGVGKAIGSAASGKKKPDGEKKPAAEKKPDDGSDPFQPGAADGKKPDAKKAPAKPGEKKADSPDPFDP